MMEVLRYKYIFFILSTLIAEGCNSQTKHNTTATTPRCPFTKIIEDVFKIQNKTTDKDLQNRDRERVKLFLTTIANISNQNLNKNDENLVNIIIDSIKRIKNTISQQTQVPNEAIIVSESNNSDLKKVNQIKSGIEDKFDDKKDKKETTKTLHTIEDITEKPEYIEVLTIDPTNQKTTTSNNFIEVLKHLMPLFNSSLTKKVHNITIIEKDRNNSLSTSKNVSQIIVTYCDKDNTSNNNATNNFDDRNKENDESDHSGDYYDEEIEDVENDEGNTTIGVKTEILEAAEYGMKKMHELYSVLEPKLYSMGLWLDDSSPARYVAAFNAPSEDAEKYSRYGYASLQAAAKLKQLTRAQFNNPFWSQEEDLVLPSTPTANSSGSSKKKAEPAKRAKKVQKKKDLPVKNPFNDESDSDADPLKLPEVATPAVKRKRIVFPDSEEESQQQPIRAVALRSSFSQRIASGHSYQSDPTKTGQYYFELRVYNTREAERLSNNERWKQALVTLKLATNQNTGVWAALTALVNASRDEMRDIRPVLYPSPQ